MQNKDVDQQQEGRVVTTASSVPVLSSIPATHSAVTPLRVAGRLPIVTSTTAVGVAAGQQGILTTVAGVRPVAMAPPAVIMPTQSVPRLLPPATSLSANTVQLSATLNVMQRQLSAPGVVGLSAVSVEDLQQVLQPITLLATTEPVSETQQRPRLTRPLSFSHSSPSLPTTSSVSATGGTIHHHGQSPVRGAVPGLTSTLSHSNLQHSLLGMNLSPQQQQQLAVARRIVTAAVTTTSSAAAIPAANIMTQSRTVSEIRAPSGQPPSLRTASGAPVRKKIKLEEKQPPSAEVASYRKQLVEMKHKQMKELKVEYFENLTEMFFLQSGLNLMDYHTWKKRPTPQLVNFLKSGRLDSDEEEDVLQVKEINSEVKVLTNPGSNVPLATPVAISTTLPPMVSALSQQVVAPSTKSVSAGSSTTAASANTFVTASSIITTSSSQQHLTREQDGTKNTCSKSQQPQLKQHRSPPMSPGQRFHTRQQSLSAVYDNLSGSSQEVIVERAKQEAQVVQKVNELRKEGLWSSKRLPRVQEPPRQKAHWDYLLEEMTWLAADFVQERKWKKAAARKVARMVSNYFKEQEQKELKAEKEEATKLKKIASHMAKMVKEFWANIEKVVQYKQQTRLEEKKKRVLDLHLNFIVDQTEKYSSWLTEGLHGGSVNGSHPTSPVHSSDGDDFSPTDSEASDDEETIAKEEEEADKDEVEDNQELEELQKDGDLPLEELLKTLPKEMLDSPAQFPLPTVDIDPNCDVSADEEEVEEDEREGSDKEFAVTEEAIDVEDTIAEQETHDRDSYQSELKDLEEEGEMSIEELAAKYAGAYDSDFQLPQDSTSGEEEEEESDFDSDEVEIETESSSDEGGLNQQTLKEEMETPKAEDSRLDVLVKPTQEPALAADTLQGKKVIDEKEEVINDITAQALSLQPKGYTLETTEVKTKVPFLLKHSLREYQHVGLDWLATMHEKRLNGILADEMGLGKTIQTIALLAHLACEKGIWGPHLIVVPTSVMLNWEMELKKWCPAFKILTYYGTLKERKLKRQGWTKTNAFHVCITSYKLVVQDHQAFRRKKWKYLILDEAQNIKNFKSQRWQMLLNFSSQRRLLLTGTPLQNSLMELWSLMHFLMPNVFQSHRDFKEWFSNPLTGMIEGSQEYNESLIKRLHKVLRPFLLRRLKNEVEKQMPKKFEHVVMCKLSKRQRYLYDDFMSQSKTKETLAEGHYMSVINILMQLRKVCNHPNLFDPRPVVSPLFMEGLVYYTSSLITKALIKDPLEEVDMHTLFPNLAEMERDLPAFIAHRVKQLKASPCLIEEVDSQPDPPPRLPSGQLKPVVFPNVSSGLVQTSEQATPLPQSLASSPVELVQTAQVHSVTPPVGSIMVGVVSQASVQAIRTAAPPEPISHPVSAITSTSATFTQVRTPSGQTLFLTSQSRGGVGPALVLSSGTTFITPGITSASNMATSSSAVLTSVSTAQPILQAKVLPQQMQSVSSTATSVLPSQPITVQIQQTEQGTRLMIPTGQLSQLPASLFQIVQTSSGQQLIATTTPASGAAALTVPAVTTASNTVFGPSAPTNVAATSGLVLVTTAANQLKTIPAPSALTVSPSPTTSSVALTSVSSKPVMRVSPIMAASSSSAVTQTTTSVTASVVSSVVSTLKSVVSPKLLPTTKKSKMYLESLEEKRRKRRLEKLKRLARVNSHHCSLTPVYGPDLLQTLTFNSVFGSQSNKRENWLSAGYANCQCVHSSHNHNLSHYYWHETNHLANLIHTPEQCQTELRDILNRFIFAIPSVISPGVSLRVAHPDSSQVVQYNRLSHSLRQELQPLSVNLNNIRMKMSIQFPELRLIQYDCGKLQTLDALLRRLKSDNHRVLIFTQMTKMLDVLEAFLNYHGHRYLRLDGTTRVEQRQALMDRFNADKRIFCFILSTRSGGIGVNLTGADTVIFYDSDWNPTMDAQAQDRCHRIGQTRDVHIYRLISEMTVEENILKKANQKRLLGDLAIEGGNFTTAFFKEQTIKDLFAEPSGLKALAEQKQQQTEEVIEKDIDVMEANIAPTSSTEKKVTGKEKDTSIIAAFEQALCKAEDESDAIAATLVKAEQKAELAEFDENIPWDEREAEARKEEEEMSRAEMELAMIDKELTPIERYAVGLMESQMEDDVAEELKMAEEDIQNSKKDWELARLKALKEEEERRAEMEDDEMLYTYLRDDAQVKTRLTKDGKVKRKPGRPPLHPPSSPSLSSSDTGSVEVKTPSRISNRIVIHMKKPAIDKTEGKKTKLNNKISLAGSRKQLLKSNVANKDNLPNVPTTLEHPVKKMSTVRARKNNVAQKKIQNGDATLHELKVVAKMKRGEKVAGGQIKPGEARSDSSVAQYGKTIRKPNKTFPEQAQNLVSVDHQESRPILKVPIMVSTQGSSLTVGSPPRNRSPAVISCPVSSPAGIPPPWSNPNLVIRTRRASLHSPVQVAGKQVIQGLVTSTQQQSALQSAGIIQQMHHPVGVVQSGGIMRLVSPGPIVALAASQSLQVVSASRMQPSLAASITAGHLSLTGARVLSTPTQQVVNAGSLQGSLVRLPDGSTAVLGQISGTNLLAAQSATTTPTLIVSGAGQPAASPTFIVSGTSQNQIGARAVLASNLAASSRTRIAAPRLTAQPQVMSAAGVRTVHLSSGTLGGSLALRGVGGMPVGVNLVKAGTSGVQIPIVGTQGLALRTGQIIQTNITRTGSPQSYVLITPRFRTATAAAVTPPDVNGPVEKKGAESKKYAFKNVFISSLDGSEMPLWAPPTPPQDDNDVYLDQTMLFLYEPFIMSESQLPPVYVRKEHKKSRLETITTRKQKQRKEEVPRVPRSLFDRPNSALVKMRRELKMQKLKAGLGMNSKTTGHPVKPATLPPHLPPKPVIEQSEGHPEWLIHEDWALLQAVKDLCHLPLNLTVYQNAHIPNWDLVADVVNGVSRTHRSIKQCKARYENVIIPREEGRILYDISPRKQKKNKSSYKTKNNRPMKTSQLFTQDNYSSISLLYSLRFDSVKAMAAKRPAPMRPTLNNPSLKNPKHLAVLQENSINYDQPLNPLQVAAIRAERIARDKKAGSAQNTATEVAQRTVQSGTREQTERTAQVVQAVAGVAAAAPTVAQTVTGQQLHSLVSAAVPTTIITGTAASRAAVAQAMSQAVGITRTITATGNIVAVASNLTRGQRVAVHDITTVAGTVTAAQVAVTAQARATLQPTASASANITQKMAAISSTSALAGVHSQLAKGLTQSINLLRPVMRPQSAGTATQAQQLRAQKLSFTKQGQLVRTVPAQFTDEQLKSAFKVRQLQKQGYRERESGGQQIMLQAAQILQQVGQSGATSQAPVTLVKSVAAPAGTSGVPIPVSINVTMTQGQQKTGLPSRGATVSQLQQQRVLLQQHRKTVPLQSQRVTALSGVRSGQIPLLIPQKGQLTGQLLHQIVKQQQIINTSQPAIISVTQGQTLSPMVAKVSLTTVPHTAPIQTFSAAAGSPITVTQVAAATPTAGVSGTPTHHTPTVATINMATVPAVSQTAVVKTATLTTVDPTQQQAAATKIATISQSLVAQPLQIVSSGLSQQPSQGQTVVAAGTQHRILSATTTTIPQATAVVVSTAALAQGQPSVTTVVQQQTQQPVVSASTVVSAQAVPSPSAMATVVTQTQSPQASPAPQQAAQLTVQQQQLQKASPYAMRTRNTPKHS